MISPSSPPPTDRPSGSRGSRLADQSGLTLIEVIVTALLVVLIATAAATALISSARASGDEQYRSQADSLAATDLDQMRGLSDAQLNALQTGSQSRQHQVTLGAVTYTVASTATYLSAAGSTSSSCTAAAGALYKIASTVSWTAEGRAQSLQNVSQLARPVAGDVVVQVTDTTGRALAGVSVSVSGSSYQSTQTNSAGCGIFDGLIPGSYTFAFSKSGYVGVNGQSPSTQTVAVPSTGTTVSYVLGQTSGPISATFGTATSGNGISGEADGLMWTNGSQTSPGISPSAGGGVNTSQTSSPGLYPGTYQVWAGRCAGQEPPSPTTVTLAAGQTVSAQVLEPALYVGMTISGSSLSPSDIWLTFRSNGCVDSWPGTLAPPGPPPPTGWLANTGQPYAYGTTSSNTTLSVCVDFWNGTRWFSSTVPVATGNDTFNSPAAANSANSVSVALTSSSSNVRCARQTS